MGFASTVSVTFLGICLIIVPPMVARKLHPPMIVVTVPYPDEEEELLPPEDGAGVSLELPEVDEISVFTSFTQSFRT